jgi:hypothetical protein
MKHILKNSLAILFFLLLTIVNFSCDKQDLDLFSTPQYSYPVVTTSVISLSGGVVEVTGVISSQGSSTVQFAGVCFGRDPDPSLLENQVLLNVVNGQFVLDIDTLITNVTYYFKAFAVNNEGYGVGNIVQLGAGAIQPPTIPCTLTNDLVYENNQAYTINQVSDGSAYASFGNWGVSATNLATNETYDIEFVNKPVTGTYTTNDASDFLYNSNDALASRIDGFGDQYYANPGANVYVIVNANGSVSISFCSLNCNGVILKGNIIAN